MHAQIRTTILETALTKHHYTQLAHIHRRQSESVTDGADSDCLRWMCASWRGPCLFWAPLHATRHQPWSHTLVNAGTTCWNTSWCSSQWPASSSPNALMASRNRGWLWLPAVDASKLVRALSFLGTITRNLLTSTAGSQSHLRTAHSADSDCLRWMCASWCGPCLFWAPLHATRHQP